MTCQTPVLYLSWKYWGHLSCHLVYLEPFSGFSMFFHVIFIVVKNFTKISNFHRTFGFVVYINIYDLYLVIFVSVWLFQLFDERFAFMSH